MTARPAGNLDPGSLVIWQDFERDLKAKQAREHTIWAYGWALVQLHRHARVPVARATKEHITSYLAWLGGEGFSRNTIDTRYRALRRFYRWAEAEGDILPAGNPMTRIQAPQMDEKLIPVISPEDEVKLLKACTGADYASRRDLAIIRLLLAPGGPRASELCGMDTADLDMARDIVLIRQGKWARDRVIPFGPACGKAVSKYLRLRGQRPDAGADALWMGKKGRLTRSGLQQMIARRCAQAGIARHHPHQLRHTAAVRAKQDRMDSGIAKELFGWRQDKMWDRYGKAALKALAVEQGHDAAARMETVL
jgi:site-specific recombinase XerD